MKLYFVLEDAEMHVLHIPEPLNDDRFAWQAAMKITGAAGNYKARVLKDNAELQAVKSQMTKVSGPEPVDIQGTIRG